MQPRLRPRRRQGPFTLPGPTRLTQLPYNAAIRGGRAPRAAPGLSRAFARRGASCGGIAAAAAGRIDRPRHTARREVRRTEQGLPPPPAAPPGSRRQARRRDWTLTSRSPPFFRLATESLADRICRSILSITLSIEAYMSSLVSCAWK